MGKGRPGLVQWHFHPSVMPPELHSHLPGGTCTSYERWLGAEHHSFPQENLELHPEQTASLLSLLTYIHVEPLIWLAWRLPRLTYEMLLALPEYDHLKHLVRRTFPVRDPSPSYF